MAKKIIKDQTIVEDSYTIIDTQETLPAGDVLVPYSRWLAQRETFDAHHGKVGVIVNGHDYDIYAIGQQLAKQALIALEFPAFTDGRCYSFATLLRQRFDFKGEIRAIGNVLKDQLNYMHRCGINAFDIEEGRDIETALKGIRDFSLAYQT